MGGVSRPRARVAISFVESVARERTLPVSVIHGDYFPGNVLLAGDELAGIVDWEEAQVDWVTWDLASAIGAFCSTGDALDLGPAVASSPTTGPRGAPRARATTTCWCR